MVTMGQWTGRETRLLRHAVRLTVRHFAEDLGVSPRTISKWETAGAARTPRPELQAALDTLLARATDQERERFEQVCRPELIAAPPVEVALPGTVVDVRGSESATPDGATVCLPLVVDGQAVLAPLDAKMLAGIGLGALLGRAAAPRPAPIMTALTPDEHERLAIAQQNPRRYFDASAVAALRRQLDACKADDQAMGPADTLPVVLSLLGFIDEQARDVTPEIRCLLLSLGARGAEFAGWLYRDLRDLPRAESWYDRATAWAQEAGDLPVQGYILLKKSQMAYDERDALRVVTLGRAAQEGPWRMPAKVRAEVCQQSARGMAMTGASLDAVRSKLDEALEFLDQSTDEDDESAHLATHYSAAQLRLQTASCYMEAGQPLMAAELYGEVLAADGLEARDQGYFLARRAHSLALAGQPDDAAAVGLDAHRLADATRSARTRRELSRTVEVLTPWRNRPGPRELREALTG
jgi:tetratricopeptide (TPR) repeat protein/DNA-binding XRE family transcriptional regulator